MATAVRYLLRQAARTLGIGVVVGGLVTTALTLGASGSPVVRRGAELVPVAQTLGQSAPGTAHRVGRPWRGHPGRRVVTYRVRGGDTASRIAVRFHAWTAELLRINHKTPASLWLVGERVRVPIVTARAGHRHHHPKQHHHPKRHHATQRKHRATKTHHRSKRAWARTTVRDEVKRVARAYGVDRNLALAIAWQESGWQQQVRSSVGAVGTMQVMPGTGRWISVLVGRRLHLHRLHDNAVAGVVLFKLLRQTHTVRGSLAGYYQGLGSLHAHGWYPSTKRYVRNVRLHWHRLDHGWHPLG